MEPNAKCSLQYPFSSKVSQQWSPNSQITNC